MSSKPETTLRLDVWGGACSCDHLARLHFSLGDPAWGARQMSELTAGFLVNVRVLGPGEGWGGCEDFDVRGSLVVGRA